MSSEKLRKRELRVLKNEPVRGMGVLAVIRMLNESRKGSEILQNGDTRAEKLIDLAAYLNNIYPGYSDELLEVGALGKNKIVTATSYDSIRKLLEAKGGLVRFFLQNMLGSKIGHVLTSEGPDYEAAAKISKPHTRPGAKHTEIAENDIAKTFDEFKAQLTSDEGLPATTLTVEMIYKIMTDTVFGGYQDGDVASWKDDIVYFLKHLIDVQQAYAVGLLAENYPENLPENLSKKVPKMLLRKLSKNNQRNLMRIVAKMQGVSGVLEEMLRIEDELFPKIIRWIEAQEAKNLSNEQLAKMGFLGAVLSVPEAERPKDMKRADIFGIYTAALDSTANAANWLLAEFAQNPEILRKVASLEGDARKQYIQFIQFELWRKDPITPIIFRQVPAGEGLTMSDGKVLEPGTILLLSVGAAGLDEKRFPNPEVFNPDRYYDMTAEEIAQVKKDLYLVFAAGDKHRCQGEGAVYLTLNALINYAADNIKSIEIARVEDGEEVIVGSNNSGVCSPVDQYGKPLQLRVFPN